MYRMLIVDDEAVITDGLCEVFQNLDMELDLCKAYSGIEAVETMKQQRVDIVLTDIRMPDMDGMELMEYILEEWPHCKIIFLTGYDVFDYAYKAINLGDGIRYILKNEGYPKIIETVRKTVEELDSELHIKDLVNQSREHLNTLETLLQGEYLRHLIKGTRDDDKLKGDFEKLNIPLNPDFPFLIVLGNFTIPDLQDSYVTRQEIGLAINFLAQSFLINKVEHIGALDRYNDLVWLIQPKIGSTPLSSYSIDLMTRQMAGTFELIGQACMDSMGVSIAFTVACHAYGFRALPRVYEQIRQLQSERVGDGAQMVQVAQIEETTDSRGAFVHSSLENVEILAIHLESGRRKEFFDVFDEITKSFVQREPSTPGHVMEHYYSIAVVLLSHLNRMHPNNQVNAKKLMNFDDHSSWSEAFHFLRQTAECLFDSRHKEEKNRATQVIDQICVYIEEHLDQDLSLVRLAKMIHFNPSYLSRLFKQEIGVNLSVYIEDCKFKRAKELLKNNLLKISEVGMKIGYDAPHSFTRFFKRMTGMTPQDYRDVLREKEMDREDQSHIEYYKGPIT